MAVEKLYTFESTAMLAAWITSYRSIDDVEINFGP